MTHLRRIELAVAGVHEKATVHRKRVMQRAYRAAADFIKRTKRRPDKPVISDVTPEWFRHGRT